MTNKLPRYPQRPPRDGAAEPWSARFASHAATVRVARFLQFVGVSLFAAAVVLLTIAVFVYD